MDEEVARRLDAELRITIKTRVGVVDAITDFFHKAKIPPQRGEIILAYVLGMSLGLRMASIQDERIAHAIARGWQFAVQKGDSHE